MLTWPPPYSPAAMAPSKEAYSSGWSSVGTARRFTPGSSGGDFGTAQLFRTPSRSSRRSQCTRSPRPRGVWCSWTTKVSSSPTGRGCPGGGTGSAGRARAPLAREGGRGALDAPGAGGLSGPGRALGRLGRLVVGVGGGLLRGCLLGRGLLRRCLLRGGLLRGRLLRGLVVPVVAVVVRGRRRAAAGPLDAAPQRAHQVHDRATV